MNKRTAVVTGASRGIGRAVAAKLVSAGFDVVGTSRSRPEDLADRIEGVRYLRLDLADPQSLDDCCGNLGDVDALINNAGISQFGPLEEISAPQLEHIFRVNVFGCIRLIQACLPGMRRRRSGAIVNVGSLAGRFSPPFYASYSGTKAALAALTWSLRNEVAQYGVRVVLVEPNDIKTTITPEVLVGDGSEYAEDAKRALDIRNRSMAAAPSPDVVAEMILKIVGAANPRPAYPVGGTGPLMVFLQRLLPNARIERLVRAHYGLRPSPRRRDDGR
jgi:short-subunit dehydrogenase